jgi:hypothetical protein
MDRGWRYDSGDPFKVSSTNPGGPKNSCCAQPCAELQPTSFRGMTLKCGPTPNFTGRPNCFPRISNMAGCTAPCAP